MLRNLFILLLVISNLLYGANLPNLNAKDVNEILKQIMQAHVSHKSLSSSLISRTLERYLEELDPMKCYFLKSEVAPWISLPESEIVKIKDEIQKNNFTTFYKIHSQLVQAVARRRGIEEKIANCELPNDVKYKEFKEMEWAETEEALFDRILRVRALQIAAAEKLDEPLKKSALARIDKRQKMHEEEILGKGVKGNDPAPFVLSHALKAFASSFDANTAYFTPHEAAQFVIQVQQRLFGIGAQLRDDLNGFTIVKIIEGGPASKNPELKENDRIIAIDNQPVVGLEITDAVELIRGPAESKILLTILRTVGQEEQKHNIEITRGEVVIKDARLESYLIPFGDGVIARLALHAFYQDPSNSSATDLTDEIARIKKEHNLKGVILDLRNNSGGVLPQAVAVAGLFITKGIVVSIQDNDGHVDHLRHVEGKMTYSGPLVVLTSKASASASEIVAQTLQDYGRAIVVGDEHTYGKGSFQTFTYDSYRGGEINPKGEFKVTRGCYYTVSGKSPQLVGVIPDLIVPGALSIAEVGEKYAQYPLENRQIAAHFEDTLDDIDPRQREQISWLYKINMQQPITQYRDLIPALKKNSEARMSKNNFYQKFLGELKKEDDCNMDFVQAAVEADPQLNEAVAITQDLILLLSST